MKDFAYAFLSCLIEFTIFATLGISNANAKDIWIRCATLKSGIIDGYVVTSNDPSRFYSVVKNEMEYLMYNPGDRTLRRIPNCLIDDTIVQCRFGNLPFVNITIDRRDGSYLSRIFGERTDASDSGSCEPADEQPVVGNKF